MLISHDDVLMGIASIGAFYLTNQFYDVSVGAVLTYVLFYMTMMLFLIPIYHQITKRMPFDD